MPSGAASRADDRAAIRRARDVAPWFVGSIRGAGSARRALGRRPHGSVLGRDRIGGFRGRARRASLRDRAAMSAHPLTITPRPVRTPTSRLVAPSSAATASRSASAPAASAVEALRGVDVAFDARARSRRSWARRARASRRSAHPRRPRPADRGLGRDRRHAPGPPRRPRPHAAAPPPGRLRLPELQPAAGPRRAEENITLPLRIGGTRVDRDWLDTLIDAVGLGDRRDAPPVGDVGRPAAARRGRAGARSRGPPSCSATSRPATSTRSRAGRSSTLMRRAVDDLGQTIVMVTHDPSAATFADRVVFLADGTHRRARRSARPSTRSSTTCRRRSA